MNFDNEGISCIEDILFIKDIPYTVIILVLKAFLVFEIVRVLKISLY